MLLHSSSCVIRLANSPDAIMAALSSCVCVCFYAGIVQIGGESVCPVDASGNFTQEITDFAGQ